MTLAQIVLVTGAVLVGAKLSGIVLETDLVASPLALPRLNVGPNHVEYTDETEGPREVTVTHEWVECEGERPPEPPAAPTPDPSPEPAPAA